MPDEFRPRPHDHIVEPVFAALRPEAESATAARDEGRGPGQSGAALKLALAALCLVALAWVVWRVVAA